MKHFIFWSILTILYTSNADADNFVWQFHDDHFYDETGGAGPGSIEAGFLTAVSDIHYTYTFDTKSCFITQKEWLSDGASGQYIAPYDSSFNYTNIYLNNPNLDTELLLFDTVDDFLLTLRNQATNDVNIMIDDIVNQMNAHNVSPLELQTITEMTVNDIFDGADITSLDIYKNLQRSISTLSKRSSGISAIATAIGNGTLTGTELTTIKLKLDYYLHNNNLPEYSRLLNRLLNKITPSTTTLKTTTTKTVLSAINNQVSNRIGNIRERSVDNEQKAVWIQGLTNHSKKTGISSFDSNTLGIITGIDKTVTTNAIIGLGYAYNNTTATTIDKQTDITGHTFFAYGEYRPSDEWYIRGLVSSGIFSYTDNANIVSSDYQTYNFGANLTTGYDWDNGFGILTSARYFNINQSNYTDSIGQHIDSNNMATLTAVMGCKYDAKLSHNFTPKLHINATYDMLQPNTKTNIEITGIPYQIKNENINPFGIETGITFNMSDDNWNFDIGYGLELHNDFISHTSHIKVKYNF